VFKIIVKKLMDTLSKISVEKEDVVGVDISPGNIRVAQLNQQKNGWMLTKLGYKYIDVVTDSYSIHNHPDPYISKLQDIIRASKITTTNAAVSIPVSSAIIKVVNLPLMTDEELQEAIETDSLWENVIQLSETLDDYSIFWQIIRRHTEENTMDLLFVASKLSDIDDYLDIVQQAGLNPVVVDVRCFSLRNALSLKKDLVSPGEPVVIFEFGPYENYVLVLKEDSPFISDIYVSDQDRTHLMDQSINPELCQKIFDRFAMQVSQVLSTYQAKYKSGHIRTILISSVLPSMDQPMKCLKNALPELNIELFNPIDSIRVPEHLKEKASAEINPTVFSSVLGLATRKLDVFGYYKYVTGTNNINLLPDRDTIRNTEKVKFFSRWGLFIVAILMIVAGVWSFLDTEEKADEVNQVVREYHELEAIRVQKQADLSDLQEKKSEITGRLESTKDIRSNQKFMYSVLYSINSSIPQGIALSSIHYEGGNSITLRGTSINDQNILTLINHLSGTKVIERASLLTMSVKEPDEKVKQVLKSFTIRCRVVDEESLLTKEVNGGD